MNLTDNTSLHSLKLQQEKLMEEELFIHAGGVAKLFYDYNHEKKVFAFTQDCLAKNGILFRNAFITRIKQLCDVSGFNKYSLEHLALTIGIQKLKLSIENSEPVVAERIDDVSQSIDSGIWSGQYLLKDKDKSSSWSADNIGTLDFSNTEQLKVDILSNFNFYPS